MIHISKDRPIEIVKVIDELNGFIYFKDLYGPYANKNGTHKINGELCWQGVDKLFKQKYKPVCKILAAIFTPNT